MNEREQRDRFQLLFTVNILGTSSGCGARDFICIFTNTLGHTAMIGKEKVGLQGSQ